MTYELEGWQDLRPAIIHALDDGLAGVAVLNPTGEAIAIGGWLERAEVRNLAALVSMQGPRDILDRLFGGELATATQGGQTIYLAIAARCVFVLAVTDVLRPGLEATVGKLRDEIEVAISARAKAVEIPAGWQPPPTGSGGSGSPPAEAFVFLHRGRGAPN